MDNRKIHRPQHCIDLPLMKRIWSATQYLYNEPFTVAFVKEVKRLHPTMANRLDQYPIHSLEGFQQFLVDNLDKEAKQFLQTKIEEQ